MSNTVSRAEFEALKEQVAGLVLFVENKTTQGNALRADRERAARKARNEQVNSRPVADFVAFAEAMRPVDRPSLHTPAARAVELARECGEDHELRARLLAVVPDGTAAEIAWSLYAPPARTQLYIPAGPESEVRTRDVRLTEEDADRAESFGLPVEWRLTPASTERIPVLLGLGYHSTNGFAVVLPRDAVVLWRSLSPAMDNLIERGSIRVRDLSDDESRAFDRAEWHAAGASRAELPALP